MPLAQDRRRRDGLRDHAHLPFALRELGQQFARHLIEGAQD